MRILKIKLGRRRSLGCGAFGSYFKLSKNRGVKVLHFEEDDNDSTAELKGSCSWSEAIEEYKLLKTAERSGCSPKPYAVAVVVSKNTYYAGIVMQHIDGVLDKDITDEQQERINDVFGDWKDVSEILYDELRKCGVKHDDLHNENIIYKFSKRKIKVYALDFSPYATKYVRKRARK